MFQGHDSALEIRLQVRRANGSNPEMTAIWQPAFTLVPS